MQRVSQVAIHSMVEPGMMRKQPRVPGRVSWPHGPAAARFAGDRGQWCSRLIGPRRPGAVSGIAARSAWATRSGAGAVSTGRQL